MPTERIKAVGGGGWEGRYQKKRLSTPVILRTVTIKATNEEEEEEEERRGETGQHSAKE